jgi:hypothetical protein
MHSLILGFCVLFIASTATLSSSVLAQEDAHFRAACIAVVAQIIQGKHPQMFNRSARSPLPDLPREALIKHARVLSQDAVQAQPSLLELGHDFHDMLSRLEATDSGPAFQEEFLVHQERIVGALVVFHAMGSEYYHPAIRRLYRLVQPDLLELQQYEALLRSALGS